MAAFNKPSKQALAELINKDNGTAYTEATLGLEGLEVYDEEGPLIRNTTAMAWHTSRPERKTRIYWNRLSLAEVITPGFATPYQESYEKVEDLLTLLNTEFDLALAVTDIQNDDIAGDGVLTIRANTASLGFIGQVNVNLSLA